MRSHHTRCSCWGSPHHRRLKFALFVISFSFVCTPPKATPPLLLLHGRTFFWQFRRQSLTRSCSRVPVGSFCMHFGKGQREIYCPSLSQSQLLLLSPFCAHAPALHFEYHCMATHIYTHRDLVHMYAPAGGW